MISVVNKLSPNTFPVLKSYQDKELLQEISSDINRKKPFYAYIYDAKEVDYRGSIDLFVALRTGRKCVVRVTDPHIFLDVVLEEGKKDPLECVDKYESVKYMTVKQFDNYSSIPINIVRITFDKLNDRKNAIRNLSSYKLSNNMMSNYYKKFMSDEGIEFGWIKVNKYKLKTNKLITFMVKKGDIETINEPPFDKNKIPLIYCGMDIETYTTEEGVRVDRPDDVLYMMCYSFSWVYEEDPFLQICVTSMQELSKLEDLSLLKGGSLHNKNPKYKDTIVKTYVVKSEKEVIMADAYIHNSMQYHISSAFNGGHYDYPFLKNKLEQHGLMGDYCKLVSPDNHKSWFRDYNVKYNGLYDPIILPFIPGTIYHDSCIDMKKNHPDEIRSSLNHFLKINNFPTKVDLDYRIQFKYYESGTPEECAKTVEYCAYDALAINYLIAKSSILFYYFEVANVSYTSPKDCILYADGGKVINIVYIEAFKRGYLFDCEYRGGSSTYEGGHVEKPVPGVRHPRDFKKAWKHFKDIPVEECDINIDKFLTTFDYTSLPERLRGDQESFDEYIEWLHNVDNDKIRIHSILVDGKEYYLPLPVPDLDFTSLYPSIMKAYNLSNENIIPEDELASVLEREPNLSIRKVTLPGDTFYTVYHDADESKYAIIPHIFVGLFAKRMHMKRLMNQAYNAMKGCEEGSDEWKEYYLAYNRYNQYQLAHKIMMNTVYGQTGTAGAPLYNKYVSAGTTYLSRQAILLAKKFMEAFYDINIVYGDTDSLYYQFHRREYMDIIKPYIDGDISIGKFTELLINRTIELSRKLQNDINKFFERVYENTCLKMVYEKTLYPCLFTSLKKNYIAYKHENSANLKIALDPEVYTLDECKRALHIAGFKFDKKNSSPACDKLCYKAILTGLSLKEERDLDDVIYDVIQHSNISDWRDYCKSMKYSIKPNSAYVKFLKAMEEKGYPWVEHPDDVGRISFIYVKRKPTVKLNGCVYTTKVGDLIEPAEIFDQEFLEKHASVRKYVQTHFGNSGPRINTTQYIKSEIAGIMGQFLLYHDRFNVDKFGGDRSKAKTAAKDEIISMVDVKVSFNTKEIKSTYASIFKQEVANVKTMDKNIIGYILSRLDADDTFTAIIKKITDRLDKTISIDNYVGAGREYNPYNHKEKELKLELAEQLEKLRNKYSAKQRDLQSFMEERFPDMAFAIPNVSGGDTNFNKEEFIRLLEDYKEMYTLKKKEDLYILNARKCPSLNKIRNVITSSPNVQKKPGTTITERDIKIFLNP